MLPSKARSPLYVGASSKILVAFAEPAAQQEPLRDPEWPATGDPAAFLRRLEEVKALGYATSVEEREPGAAAVAVPIMGRGERLVAALAVSGPSNRLTPRQMKEIAPVLMEASRRMGKMVK
ncbi:hypothetical protein LJK88_03030 [Paenibacillus sp. P26]|nr:hypothetical protein LJK88_03030 [Paenibacillus sp. P26]